MKDGAESNRGVVVGEDGVPEGHVGLIAAAEFSPDESGLMTRGNIWCSKCPGLPGLIIWRLDARKPPRSMYGYVPGETSLPEPVGCLFGMWRGATCLPVKAARFLPDGKHAVICGGGRAEVIELPGMQRTRILFDRQAMVEQTWDPTEVAVSETGVIMVVCGATDEVSLWGTREGAEVKIPTSGRVKIASLARDGRFVSIVEEEGTGYRVAIWRIDVRGQECSVKNP